MKIIRTVAVPKDLWNKAQRKKLNCSAIMTQTLEIILGVSQNKNEILKEIEEKEQEVSALKTKLQQLKVKDGMSFGEYLQLIDENDNYTTERKQILKDEIFRSIDMILKNPDITVGRVMLLKNKYGLELTAKMLISFSKDEDLEKIKGAD